MSQLDNQTFFFNPTNGALGNNMQRGCYAKGALWVMDSLAKGQQSSPPSWGLRLLESCMWPFLFFLWNHNQAPHPPTTIAANLILIYCRIWGQFIPFI